MFSFHDLWEQYGGTMMKQTTNVAILLLTILVAILIFASLPKEGASQEVPLYGVIVSTDDSSDSGEPGETIEFQVKVKNTGTLNDSYFLDILDSDFDKGAKDWAHFEGVDGKETCSIQPNETEYYNLVIEIPDFTPENDNAGCGIILIEVRARSTNASVESSVFFEVEIEELYRVRIWSDVPGKQDVLRRNRPTEMSFTLYCRNLGNTYDEIMVYVPYDLFCGQFKDWEVRFGSQSYYTFKLDSLEQRYVIMTVTIDKNTVPGNYSLAVRAESQGDTSIYCYTTCYVNLTEPIFGVELQERGCNPRQPRSCFPRLVNPADGLEIPFSFTLTNIGNQDDTYTLQMETPLGSGTYKGWVMEFEDNTETRVDSLSIPGDLKGSTDLYLSKNGRVDTTLYVIVAIDEDEGFYSDIIVSATSDNDITKVDYLSFNLSVILPNIRVSDDPADFWIEPDSLIEEGDDVDIHLRLYNDGGAETGGFWVFFYNGKRESRIYDPGNHIALEKVENIGAGQSSELSVTWNSIGAGENDIYVHADKPIRSGEHGHIQLVGGDDGLVRESRENDNTASIDDEFQDVLDLRPDLSIDDVVFSTNICGQECIVSVLVENIGAASADIGTAVVALKIGGVSITGRDSETADPMNLERIDVGDSLTCEFAWKIPEEPRNYTVKVSVDHPDDYDSPNCRKTFYIQTIPPPHGDGWEESTVTVGRALQYSILTLISGIILGLVLHVYLASRRNDPKDPLKNSTGSKASKSDLRSGGSNRNSMGVASSKLKSPPSPKPPPSLRNKK